MRERGAGESGVDAIPSATCGAVIRPVECRYHIGGTDMHVDVRNAGDVIIVDLSGRLIAGTGDVLLREVMNELVASGWKKVLLNLSEVNSIDSAGVGELVASIKMAERFGTMVKTLRIGDRVRHVLQISKILPRLDVYEDEGEAVKAFQKAAAKKLSTEK